MKTKNKILTGVGVFLLFLMLTNPTKKDFADYSGVKDCRRELNFFVASVYQYNNWDLKEGYTEHRVNRYIGIAKNFIQLKEETSISLEPFSDTASVTTAVEVVTVEPQ
jgi:hypothetical protein